MRLRAFGTLAAVTAALVLGGCGSDGDKGESGGASGGGLEVVQDGRLTVGTELNYKPLEYIEDGEIKGFEMDLIRAIAERIGLEARIVNSAFDTLVPQLIAGQYDVVIAGISNTAERRKRVDFSENYYEFSEALVTKRGSPIRSAEQMSGREIASLSGSAANIYLEETYPDAKLVLFPALEAMLNALRSDQVDGAWMDDVTAAVSIREDDDLAIAFQEGARNQPAGILVRKQSPELRRAIDEALVEVIRDGTYERIYTEYIGEAPPEQFRKAATP